MSSELGLEISFHSYEKGFLASLFGTVYAVSRAVFCGSWTDLLATATEMGKGGGFVGAAVTAVHRSLPGAWVNPGWHSQTPFLDLSCRGTQISPGRQFSTPTSHA